MRGLEQRISSVPDPIHEQFIQREIEKASRFYTLCRDLLTDPAANVFARLGMQTPQERDYFTKCFADSFQGILHDATRGDTQDSPFSSQNLDRFDPLPQEERQSPNTRYKAGLVAIIVGNDLKQRGALTSFAHEAAQRIHSPTGEDISPLPQAVMPSSQVGTIIASVI